MGFQMLTEKFDACLGTSGSPLFVSGLHCEPFCTSDGKKKTFFFPRKKLAAKDGK